MKTWKHGIFGILAIIALTFVFIACGGDKDEHTHEWEWKVTTPATPTADGLETETCKTCGAESGNTRIIATPQDWETTVDLFEIYKATVKGISLLPSEWNGVANKVATAIIGARSIATTGGTLTLLYITFANNDVVIIVEKTTAYKCKVNDGEFRTLYLSFNYLNDTGLQATITAATNAMAREKGGYKLE